MKPAGFRRRDALHQHTQHYGPNMTPMVDVVMVILIFYMSVASFAGQEWFLRTALPKPATMTGIGGEQPPPEADPFALGAARFEITLFVSERRTLVRGQGFDNVPIGELAASLRRLALGTSEADIVLIIRSEPGVPYGDVIRAHDAAAAANITQVGLMDVER